MFDVSDSVYSVMHVILDKIQDSVLQTSVLEHCQREGALLLQDPTFVRPIRVLSDIDDTLVHSGLGLGGPKLPKGTVLPGYVKLLEVLQARVAFVTARPEFVQKFTHRTLRGHYNIPTAIVLSGHLKDSLLVPFKPTYANKLISARKLTNIEHYQKTFPESRFIWFGDSGQGDIIVGQQMIKADPTGTMVLGAYIQDVVRKDGLHFKSSPEERAAILADSKVHVVDNYLDVAKHLHLRGLLSLEGKPALFP